MTEDHIEKVEKAECLYQEALSGGASPYHIHTAIRDLDDFLNLFPDHARGRAMQDLLQTHLKETM